MNKQSRYFRATVVRSAKHCYRVRSLTRNSQLFRMNSMVESLFFVFLLFSIFTPNIHWHRLLSTDMTRTIARSQSLLPASKAVRAVEYPGAPPLHYQGGSDPGQHAPGSAMPVRQVGTQRGSIFRYSARGNDLAYHIAQVHRSRCHQ